MLRLEMCRSLSDDEPIPTNEHLNVAQVMFSTPVSSQKVPRASVLKSTRFQLPSSEEKSHHKNNNSVVCTTRYINVSNFIGLTTAAVELRWPMKFTSSSSFLNRSRPCHPSIQHTWSMELPNWSRHHSVHRSPFAAIRLRRVNAFWAHPII